MRVHVLGLPNLDTVAVNAACAYTQKVRRLCDMLTMQNHDVVLYGRAENEADVAEFVPCVDTDRFPSPPADEVFNEFDPASPIWAHFNQNVIDDICTHHYGLDDLIAVTMGWSQSPVTEAFPHHIAFESGVGYEGSFLDFRVFESAAWQHHTYGRQNINDGRFYDTVIPNAYDPDEFTPRFDHDDYLLFLGRHIPRKGIQVIAELAERGHRIVTAGQGGPIDGCEYVGIVAGDDKAKLLAGAKALVAPTLYIEPFGGVAVEAQMSGTPVIASPYGAFPETVVHARTGFLCHTLGEFDAACGMVDALDHRHIHDRAVSLYSTSVVSVLYDVYLQRLATLRRGGWYA